MTKNTINNTLSELSPAQKRMWLVSQNRESSIAYNIPSCYIIRGYLDIEKFRDAFFSVINRHESLQSNFLVENNGLYRKTGAWTIDQLQLPVIDVSRHTNADAEADRQIDALVASEFDLANGPLIRAGLFKLKSEEYLLALVVHHIVADGHSFQVLLRDWLLFYTQQNLPVFKTTYHDYIQKKNQFIQTAAIKEQERFWLQRFKEKQEVLHLPVDFPRPALQSFDAANFYFTFSPEQTRKIHELAQLQKTTLFILLLSVLKLLLHKLSRQQDITIGAPFSGRNGNNFHHAGMFVNTLPIRSTVVTNRSFSEHLRELTQLIFETYENEDYPFEELYDKLKIKRDLSRNPVFDVMFSFQEQDNPLSISGLAIEPYQYDCKKVAFDLLVEMTDSDTQITCKFQYNKRLFMPATIERYANYLKNITDRILAAPQITIGDIDMLSEAEKTQLLLQFNNTAVPSSNHTTIASLFREQVKRNIDALALVFGNKRLSYRQLDEQSSQLAAFLQQKGITTETMVPICIERSFEMIIGIIGILKAGAAYVPIDPELPRQRFLFILEDIKATVLLCSSYIRSALQPEQQYQTIELDSDWHLISQATTCKPVNEPGGPNNLAYVLYTSGSTGEPKGVQMENGALVNMLTWQQKQFINKNRNVLQFASLTFDVSFQEIFSTLCFGSTLFLIDAERRKSIADLVHYIQLNSITHLFVPYIVLKSLAEYVHDTVSAFEVEEIITAGEQLKLSTDIHYLINRSGCRLINQYGPTEAHVVSGYTITGKGLLPPIGKPIDNTQLYILDEEKKLCPTGVQGELYIGGVQVARGYLNRPALTAEKFLADPFSKQPDARLYKTGDICRWLPDGNLEYVGRTDDQVKIRGYRIETGEVETILLQSNLVSRAVVVAREDALGNKRLIAYIIPLNGFNKTTIRTFLLEKLPEYMIPAVFVSLDQMPLTATGKVDKKLLPEVQSTPADNNNYTAPKTETEKALAKIWGELFDLAQIGVHDNFLELGGHSLLAVKLILAIRKELQVELTIKELFAYPTIATLANYLQQKEKKLTLPALTATTRPALLPLSFGQERLWFLDQLEGSVHYHIPLVLKLKGKVNKAALRQALTGIVNRHEILRTVIEQHNGQHYQKILPAGLWQLNEQDPHVSIQDLINAPFDLYTDHTLRASLITISAEEYLLVITIHHIAFDEWSMPFFTAELSELYNASVAGRSPRLPMLNIQYADYALWQRRYLNEELLTQKLSYWQKQLQGIQQLNLPTDRLRPAVKTQRGASFSFKINTTLVNKLQALSTQQEVTLYTTLLAAFNVLLYRYCGQEDISAGIPVANRQQHETEQLLGFFINTIVIRSNTGNTPSFVSFLKQVKHNLIDAFSYQDVPFEKVVQALVTERDMSTSPLFQVMFIMLNNDNRAELQLTGLEIEPVSIAQTNSKFDLTFYVEDKPGNWRLVIEYNTDLYNEATIARMANHYHELLHSITKTPEAAIHSLNILERAEQEQVLTGFNNNPMLLPAGKTVIDLFVEMVTKYAGNIAAAFEGQQLTYRKLHEQSNQLASYLIKAGVGPETMVPICVHRSLHMITGILGILKAGAAYVPVDPDYPAERIEYIISDTNAHIIVCTAETKNRFTEYKLVELDADWETINKEPITPAPLTCLPESLAYVIYTSGSTGRPKGVMIEHKALLNRLLWTQQYFNLHEQDVFLQKTTFCFDVSVWELLWPLTIGAKLVFAKPDGHKDNEYLQHIIETENITIVHFVPSMLEVFLLGLEKGACTTLEKILCSGEALKSTQVKICREKMPHAALHNLYGPTEAAIDVTCWSDDGIEEVETVPIGKPVSNTQIYILDKNGITLPIGVPGELHIGGVQLARGYLGQPQLTTEKFATSPLDKTQKLYKTGDLAKWLPNGNIVYLGRLDDQVKINGFRIEPGEIETVLQEHDMITQAVVIVREEAHEKKLVAYYTSPESISTMQLRKLINKKLPAHCMPQFFIRIDEIPLTASGKANKKYLQSLPIGGVSANRFIAPATEWEIKLAAVWQEVLSIDKISTTDDFFSLGGSSILVIKAVTLMKLQYGIKLTIRDLMNQPLGNIALQCEKKFINTDK